MSRRVGDLFNVTLSWLDTPKFAGWCSLVTSLRRLRGMLRVVGSVNSFRQSQRGESVRSTDASWEKSNLHDCEGSSAYGWNVLSADG